jgi:hypothetical protein
MDFDLHSLRANAAVLAYTEGGYSHSDLGGELELYAREAGLEVVVVGISAYPSLVAVTDRGLVVSCARGMQHLGLRAGPEPPVGARLEHSPVAELGEGWWWVHPWSVDVPKPEVAAEMRAWFAAAAAARPG